MSNQNHTHSTKNNSKLSKSLIYTKTQRSFSETRLSLLRLIFSSFLGFAVATGSAYCDIDPLSYSTFGDPVMFSFGITNYLNQSIINELAFEETTATTNKTIAPTTNLSSTPKKLAEKYPIGQRTQFENAFTEALSIYKQLEAKYGIPANDVAGALAAYLLGNYEAYYDVTLPEAQLIKLINQMRTVLTVNAVFTNASATEKRQVYEEMAIIGVFMVVGRGEVNKQPNNTTLKNNFRQTAKLNLEQFLGISVDRLKIDGNGLAIAKNSANLNTVPPGSENNDNLQGTSADDLIEGLGGNDTLDGKEGSDTASYQHAPKKVTVNLAKNSATGGAGKDKLKDIENVIGSAFADTLTGSGSNNSLSGLAGNDKLIGGLGNDTLIGGTGVDSLTGGKGADQFRFDSLPNSKTNADKITDFSKAQGDQISLDPAIFPNQTFASVKKLAFAKNGEQIIYEKSTGRLYYDADGAGSGIVAQLLATLANKPTLDNSALTCQPRC